MWNPLLILVFAANAFFITSAQVQCTRPHEIYKSGSACQTTCATYESPCPIVNAICNACYCEDGYARDDSDICIPISECRETSAKLSATCNYE